MLVTDLGLGLSRKARDHGWVPGPQAALEIAVFLREKMMTDPDKPGEGADFLMMLPLKNGLWTRAVLICRAVPVYQYIPAPPLCQVYTPSLAGDIPHFADEPPHLGR